jgi:hypothetical protein
MGGFWSFTAMDHLTSRFDLRHSDPIFTDLSRSYHFQPPSSRLSGDSSVIDGGRKVSPRWIFCTA